MIPTAVLCPGHRSRSRPRSKSRWHRQTVTVREFRWMNASPVIFFEGIEDRTEAETLVKAILWVDHQDDQASC